VGAVHVLERLEQLVDHEALVHILQDIGADHSVQVSLCGVRIGRK
jgi:hypothetical protein